MRAQHNIDESLLPLYFRRLLVGRQE